MSDTDARIGQRLQELRGNMSQAALGEAMAKRGHKWSQATVWSVESGKRPIRLAEAADVADALGKSVQDLLAETENDRLASDYAQKLSDVEAATANLIDAGKALQDLQADLLKLSRLVRDVPDGVITRKQREPRRYTLDRVEEIASTPAWEVLEEYLRLLNEGVITADGIDPETS